MMRLVCLSTVFLLLGYFTYEGFSLQCYACNSANDPSCDDPFKHYTIGVINCSMREQPEHLDPAHRESKVCRKTVQYVQGTKRVVRTCGYLTDADRDDKLCARKSGTHEVLMYYCSCTTDLCNTASSTYTPFAVVFTLVFITLHRLL